MTEHEHDLAGASADTPGQQAAGRTERVVVLHAGRPIRVLPRPNARIYRRSREGETLRLVGYSEGFAEVDLGLVGRGFVAADDVESTRDSVAYAGTPAAGSARLAQPSPVDVPASDSPVASALQASLDPAVTGAEPEGRVIHPAPAGAGQSVSAAPAEPAAAAGGRVAAVDALRARLSGLAIGQRASSISASPTASRIGEAIGVCVALGVLAAVRVARLGTVPRIITADETDNLQNAYHIIAGTGPGFFGFDWKPAPIFSLYPLAWTIQAFGNSVADFRMFPVILSLLTLVAFYAVARDVMRPAAALPAMLLLGTNLWFLHFSRTAWENMNASLFALGAVFTVTRAIRTERLFWWAGTGVFTAFGLYGYFTGRFIFLSVGLATFLAIAFRLTSWRPALRGLAVAAVVAAVLFAPMAKRIYEDWDRFNTRTSDISVFHTTEPYEGDTNGWVIAAKNVARNARGFILQDGSEFTRGLWARYNPDQRAPLDAWTAPLLWFGLVVGAMRWRKTYSWWTLFVPLFIAEVFSRGTPDLARGLIIAPFFFLFIGLLFEELLQRNNAPLRYGAAVVVIGTVGVYASITNVRDYFDWQQKPAAQNARLPGADRCEFPAWRQLAETAAHAGHTSLNPAAFDAVRKQLQCSPIARASLEEKPQQPTTPATALTPAQRDDQRRRDLDALRLALLAFAAQEGTFPVTANVQTLCQYKADDVGCKLTKVLDSLPADPSGPGYWYRSDGDTFILYAQLETTAGGCTALPEGFFKKPEAVYCVQGQRP